LLFCARAAHILSAIDPATGKPLDDAHAKQEIAIFMAAGFETTSHAITWCLTMLVRLLLLAEYQFGAVQSVKIHCDCTLAQCRFTRQFSVLTAQ
jgi:hypothetical protein